MADGVAHHSAIYPRDTNGRRPLPPDRQHQGVSADLPADRWWPWFGDRGHQLLRLPAGIQFFLSRLFGGDYRGSGHGYVGAQLAGRAPDRVGRGRMKANRLIIHALVIVLALLVLGPFLWLLRLSFETNAQIFAFPPRLWF